MTRRTDTPPAQDAVHATAHQDDAVPDVSETEAVMFAEPHEAPLPLWQSLVMPVLLYVFVGYLVGGMVAMRVPEGADFPGPRFFPGIIAAVLTLLATLLVIKAIRDHLATRGDSASAVSTAAPDSARRFDLISFIWVVGGFFAFAMLLSVLGWVLAAGLLFTCVAYGFGAKNMITNVVSGLTVSSVAYIAFDMGLGLSLPSGILGWGF